MKSQKIRRKGSYNYIRELVEEELNLAEIYLIKLLYAVYQKQKMQAVLHFRESFNLYQKLQTLIDKKFPEDELLVNRVTFGSGFFNIVLHILPQNSLMSFLKLFGYAGESVLGENYLNKCASMNNIRSNYAALLLAMYHSSLT